LAYYQIVVADARSPRDGRFIEILGNYDPNKEFDKYRLDHAKALQWLKNGAQPTETVRSILSHEGVLLKYHLYRMGKSEEEIQSAYEQWKAHRTAKTEKAKSILADQARKASEEKWARERGIRQNRAEALKAKRSAPAEA
jgi:small subunit ribosomal protein S16